MLLFLRNLFFTILQPGIVAGLIPYSIAKENFSAVWAEPLHTSHYAAIFIFICGVVITLHCIFNFGINGRGTLSPADPTKRLVISGLYKYSRNPMYVGVTLTLFGEIIFSQSTGLLLYSLCVFTAFYVFIVYWEEPRLKKDFGDEYERYRMTVRRWF